MMRRLSIWASKPALVLVVAAAAADFPGAAAGSVVDAAARALRRGLAGSGQLRAMCPTRLQLQHLRGSLPVLPDEASMSIGTGPCCEGRGAGAGAEVVARGGDGRVVVVDVAGLAWAFISAWVYFWR